MFGNSLILFTLIGLSQCNNTFSVFDCQLCVRGNGIYLELGNSLIDVANTMLYRDGYACVDYQSTAIPWIFLSGYSSELSCISGQTTIYFSNSGDKLALLLEVVSQLHHLAVMMPGCRRGLRQRKKTLAAVDEEKLIETATPKDINKIPSGKAKMAQILALHNKFGQMAHNNLDLVVAAAVTGKEGSGMSFEKKLEALVGNNKTMTTPPSLLHIISPTLKPYLNNSITIKTPTLKSSEE